VAEMFSSNRERSLSSIQSTSRTPSFLHSSNSLREQHYQDNGGGSKYDNSEEVDGGTLKQFPRYCDCEKSKENLWPKRRNFDTPA